MDLVEKNGAWLVDSGIVSVSHVKLITDTSHRDVHTLYSLWIGIQDQLDEDSVVSGLLVDVIRTNSFVFDPTNSEVCELTAAK